ncbi:MAG: prolipoprotein diacylglyceryl transferase family protein [Rheinheimera sp.]|nr:prolipoprotein diacylglyceryl transferase family protein [Rheinheimera sp.]
MGALIGAALVCHKKHISLWWLLDRMVFPTLIFAVMVRLGNFCNSEIYGISNRTKVGALFSNA